MAPTVGQLAPKCTNSQFAIVDNSVVGDPINAAPNVTGLLFKEQETGYLVGYLAGLVVKNNIKVSGAKAVSSVGGLKIPPVDRFIAGYQKGAVDANPGLKTLNGYSQDFVDQAKCKELALSQIEQGSGVVFQVAGGCGLGALEAAGEKGVWGIGVDADQSAVGPQVLTSAVKRVESAVFLAIKAAQDGTLKGGTDNTYGLAEDGVALGTVSPDVPQALVDEVNAKADEIKAGTVKIPADGRGLIRAGTRDVDRCPRSDARSPGTTVLELRGITKRFGDFIANDRIDLDVRAGEVHALLGENGAGKSTLMNCLYGLYRPDEGEIVIEGQVQHFTSSADAIGAGIGMVHQHFMLIPVMTVTENIVLAAEPRDGPFLDMAEAERRVARAVRPLRPAGRPAAPRGGHRRRHAAARRDPEGALPRRPAARARRADRRADAAGGARAVRRAARAARPRHGHHPDHAQARRGARDRRPRVGAAARRQGRDDPRRGRHRARPGRADGRPRGAARGRRRRRRTRARRCSRSTTCTSPTTVTWRP